MKTVLIYSSSKWNNTVFSNYLLVVTIIYDFIKCIYIFAYDNVGKRSCYLMWQWLVNMLYNRKHSTFIFILQWFGKGLEQYQTSRCISLWYMIKFCFKKLENVKSMLKLSYKKAWSWIWEQSQHIKYLWY